MVPVQIINVVIVVIVIVVVVVVDDADNINNSVDCDHGEGQKTEKCDKLETDWSNVCLFISQFLVINIFVPCTYSLKIRGFRGYKFDI